MKPFRTNSSNGKVSGTEVLLPASGGFRDSMKDSLSGRVPTTPGGANLSEQLGINWGSSNETDAFELFDIPTDFQDFHELRRLIAKSDIPAEMVQPLMVILALAERYNSTVIPSLVGWFLVGRIGKNRMGRREFIKASQHAAMPKDSDDD